MLYHLFLTICIKHRKIHWPFVRYINSIQKGFINSTLFQSFFGFGQSADIDIILDGKDTRKYAEIKAEDGRKEKYLLYYDGETVSGKVINEVNSSLARFRND